MFKQLLKKSLKYILIFLLALFVFNAIDVLRYQGALKVGWFILAYVLVFIVFVIAKKMPYLIRYSRVAYLCKKEHFYVKLRFKRLCMQRGDISYNVYVAGSYSSKKNLIINDSRSYLVFTIRGTAFIDRRPGQFNLVLPYVNQAKNVEEHRISFTEQTDGINIVLFSRINDNMHVVNKSLEEVMYNGQQVYDFTIYDIPSFIEVIKEQ